MVGAVLLALCVALVVAFVYFTWLDRMFGGLQATWRASAIGVGLSGLAFATTLSVYLGW